MLKNFLREYNINRIFLSIIGLWPFQNKYLRHFLRTLFLLLEISYCLFEILLLYDHWGDSKIVFDACYQLAISTSFIGRQMNEMYNHDKMRRLYQAIDEHWDLFTNDTEVQIMKHYSMLSRKFTRYYSMLMFGLMIVLSLTPLTPILLDIVIPLNESRPRFFAIEIEFRVDKEDYFLPIFFYTTVIMVLGVNIVMAIDGMHVTCTIHACSLFAAVSKQIESIISKATNNEIGERKCHMNIKLDRLNEEIIYREYVICLKKHQLAIEFVKTLESSYRELSLLLLVLLIGTLSLVGIRIIYVLNQVWEMIKFMFLFSACLVTLMIVCFTGQRLMDESQNIFHQAYAAEWYKFSPRLKSLLIITLYRSIIPCGLKAGSMVPLSIATFAGVVRITMSYFTAFTSFKDDY